MSRIGSKISSLRMAKNLTQKQLAKMLGVSEKFIIEVETGKKVISDELIKRASKVLGEEINELNVISDEKVVLKEEKISSRNVVNAPKPEVQKVWNDAFGSILKAVPVYDYHLYKVLYIKHLPIVTNKVEGYAKDKVLFIEIQNNDMIGFRIMKGDLAFAYSTADIENNAICLVEYAGERVIRQLKKLDSDKVMLLCNNGKLVTETVSVKNLKVLARLVRLEIRL